MLSNSIYYYFFYYYYLLSLPFVITRHLRQTCISDYHYSLYLCHFFSYFNLMLFIRIGILIFFTTFSIQIILVLVFIRIGIPIFFTTFSIQIILVLVFIRIGIPIFFTTFSIQIILVLVFSMPILI